MFSFQLYRLVFSLRHSKEEREDLDWEEEEKRRRARQEARDKKMEKNASDTGWKENKSHLQRLQTNTDT